MNNKTSNHPHLDAKEILSIESFFQNHLDGAVWRIGVHEEDTKTLEEAGTNAVTSLTKLLPNFKKSSRILCLGAHAINLGQHLVKKYECKVEVFCDEATISEAAYKKLTELDTPEKLVLSRGLLTALPYDWNLFDMVLNVESLGFHENKEKVLREISYALKPSGRVLFTLLFQQKASGEQHEWAERLNLVTLARYYRLAQNVDLERVLAKDRTAQLVQHYDFLHTYLQQLSAKDKKELGAKTVNNFSAWLEAYSDSLKESNLGWGILQFQKRNV
ncbi:MAG: methyltransferase domain-containing protein [Bacteroidota bacterium]